MPRKTGLGRGLGALIPEGEMNLTSVGVSQIPIHKISANPRQPRTQINPDELKELAASIAEVGILQPLIVTPGETPGTYFLIAGERRLKAAQQIGLELVPAVVRPVDGLQQLELALIENIQRSDLTPLETAEAYRQLSEEFGLTQEEIAHRVGKSRVSVANTLRLLKLAPDVRQGLAGGLITEGHARALLGLSTPQAQSAALQTVISHELNVRQTEELVKKLSGLRPPAKHRTPSSPEIQAIEERLRESLGTRVNLHHGPKGGSMVIHFYSDEELNALVAHILKE